MKPIQISNIEEARTAIRARMAELGISEYQLWQMAAPLGVGKGIVYEFCKGSRGGMKTNLPAFLIMAKLVKLDVVIQAGA